MNKTMPNFKINNQQDNNVDKKNFMRNEKRMTNKKNDNYVPIIDENYNLDEVKSKMISNENIEINNDDVNNNNVNNNDINNNENRYNSNMSFKKDNIEYSTGGEQNKKKNVVNRTNIKNDLASIGMDFHNKNLENDIFQKNDINQINEIKKDINNKDNKDINNKDNKDINNKDNKDINNKDNKSTKSDIYTFISK